MTIKIGIIERDFYFQFDELQNSLNLPKADMPQHGDFVVETFLNRIKQLKEQYGDVDYELYALPTDKRALNEAIRLDLDIINLSRTHSGVNERLWKGVSDEYNITLFAAAGNDGGDEEEHAAQQDHWIAVGALDRKGIRTDYSSYGLGDVFCMAQGNVDSDIPGMNNTIKGTSFACPNAVAIHTLFIRKFKNKNGRKPTRLESMAYVKNNCVDLENEGKDIYTGWGEYTPIKESEPLLELKLNNKIAKHKGKEFELRVAPFMKEYSAEFSATCTELRPIFEKLGYKVEWDKETRTAIIREVML